MVAGQGGAIIAGQGMRATDLIRLKQQQASRRAGESISQLLIQHSTAQHSAAQRRSVREIGWSGLTAEQEQETERE